MKNVALILFAGAVFARLYGAVEAFAPGSVVRGEMTLGRDPTPW